MVEQPRATADEALTLNLSADEREELLAAMAYYRDTYQEELKDNEVAESIIGKL